jgi:hypothetical protein
MRSLHHAFAFTALALASCGQSHPELDAGAADAASTDSSADAAPLDAAAGDGSSPDAGRAIDARAYEFCVGLTELRCRGNEACCSTPDRAMFLDWFTSCDGESIRESCEQWASDRALQDGTVRWDEEATQGLLDELARGLSTCGAVDRRFDLSQFFEGTLAEGETCTPDLPYGRSVGSFRCQIGLRCALTGSETAYSGTCRPLGSEGEPCNNDCAADLWCNGALGEGGDPFIGRCDREEYTSACGRDTWCRSGFCDRGPLRCAEPEPGQTWCGFTG